MLIFHRFANRRHLVVCIWILHHLRRSKEGLETAEEDVQASICEQEQTHVSVGRRRPLGHTLQETNDSRLQRLQAIINLPVFLNLSFNAEPDGAA